MRRIKIISGWSNPGGSTIAHINLCNLFNENDIECTFHGPHDWHLDKCKGTQITNENAGNLIETVTDDDILICHFIPEAPKPPNVGQMILSCHETNMYPLKNFPYRQYDFIHYVSNPQKEWQAINHPNVVIPNIVNKIEWEKPNTKMAGVVGSIDDHKKPHLAIQAAFKAGYNKVLIFGNVTNPQYFDQVIKPLTIGGAVIVVGHEDDRTKMYNSVDKIYHASERETYGLVEAECQLAGIPFEYVGETPQNTIDIVDEEEILRRWTKVLQLS